MTTSWGTCGNSGRDVSRFHLHVHADHRRQPEAPGLVRHDDDDEQLSTSDDPGESSGSLSARCFLRYACWSASRLLSPPIAKLLRIVLESRCCRSQHDTAEFAHLRQTTRINNAAVVAEGAVKPTPLRSEEPRQVAWGRSPAPRARRSSVPARPATRRSSSASAGGWPSASGVRPTQMGVPQLKIAFGHVASLPSTVRQSSARPLRYHLSCYGQCCTAPVCLP